jgi:UDP-N-acetylglucosamine acyltransferase
MSGAATATGAKTRVDPTARIESGAVIGEGAQIGPYCTIGPNVAVGENCRLVAHVNITGHTTIGARTVIHPFASLGSPPQSFSYRGGPTKLTVGVDCDIRENVTMNTGTEDDRAHTEVGDKCFFMVGSHVGHDCKVGNNVVFANNTMLGGHVSVGDRVVFGGNVAVRQFVRIGEGAMIVGMSGVRADVIPFGMAQGPLAFLVGLNVVGMRRRGLSKAEIHGVRAAYRELFFGDGEFRARIDKVAAEHTSNELVNRIFEFIRAGKRPFTMAIKRGEADTDS